MSHVLIITTSLRQGSNSDWLARQVAQGAGQAGHTVEVVSLKDKTLGFCRGCFACQTTLSCVCNDDGNWFVRKVKEADTLVFVTPIYYYEMSGQCKTLLDRLNPLFPANPRFQHVYMVSTAAEDEPFVPQRAQEGLAGWVECFEQATLAGSCFFGGLTDIHEAQQRDDLQKKAYAFGTTLL